MMEANKTFNEAFNKANETVHPVETQWHYETMTEAGYEAKTPEGTGFVRSYDYVHPTTGSAIEVTTGANADYWVDQDTKATGYWADLKPYLAKLAGA